MTDTPPRLLIVDDHRLLREGLRKSLMSNGFAVIGEASDGQEAISRATALQPDLVLMDVSMPILDGLSATRRLVQQDPDARVVMLTMHDDQEVKTRAQSAGAKGFVVKDCSTKDIVRTLLKVLEKTEDFVDATTLSPSDADGPTLPTPKLTKRETEVLQCIANGHSTAETASMLYVSQKTVKNHLASVYSKLGAHDRTQAVLKGARLGIVTLAD